MTLADAIERFQEDKLAQGLRPATISRYRDLWKSWLLRAAEKGLADLEDWTPQALTDWRTEWTLAPSTHRLRLTQLRHFFRFCVEHEWLERNPTTLLKPPKQRKERTPPLTPAEAKRLVRKAREISEDLYALALLMLYSGLAIRDATTLRRDSLHGSLLHLHRVKSGERVRVDLPPPVLSALAAIKRPGEYFFWTARSDPSSVAKYWRTRLIEAAEAAGIAGFHPHRLRHTFAVRLLGSGFIEMEQLSILMGHSSVQTTEKYYASWDPRRQSLLVRKVRQANECDPLLKGLPA